MKKIAVVTGSRAEYGVLKPALEAIQAQKDLKLFLVVTGMHLSREFGYTVTDIEKDGFEISARVEMITENDTLEAMAKSVGMGIIGMANTWAQMRPDIIVVIADRIEPLAAAISGAYMNIPVAHIAGGDSSKGGLDEYSRHAITKFAHIHFPATETSAGRILKMGEDEWRVHMVGSLALDVILNEELIPEKDLIKKFGIDNSKPLVLLVQHPVTTEADKSVEQMTETLEAITGLHYPVILLYPNADAGGRRMIELIKNYENKYDFITTIKSLPRLEFLSLMKIARVMVGNSSSGIIEAPSFGLPVVNIGTRQEGREKGNNIIDVGYKRADITVAVRKALNDVQFLKEVRKCYNPYGDGKTAPRIAEILTHIEKTPQLLQKKIAY